MHQNTPPLSLPPKNDILTQTKKEEQETYHIKVNVTKMLWKLWEAEVLNAEECLINQAD